MGVARPMRWPVLVLNTRLVSGRLRPPRRVRNRSAGRPRDVARRVVPPTARVAGRTAPRRRCGAGVGGGRLAYSALPRREERPRPSRRPRRRRPTSRRSSARSRCSRAHPARRRGRAATRARVRRGALRRARLACSRRRRARSPGARASPRPPSPSASPSACASTSTRKPRPRRARRTMRRRRRLAIDTHDAVALRGVARRTRLVRLVLAAAAVGALVATVVSVRSFDASPDDRPGRLVGGDRGRRVSPASRTATATGGARCGTS